MSAFAGNKYLISPELMVRERFITKSDLKPIPAFSNRCVDYPGVTTFKDRVFGHAYERFCRTKKRHGEYRRFCKCNAAWLDDFALFVALKIHFRGARWVDWPKPVRDRHPKVLRTLRKSLRTTIEREKFLQYVLSKQWYALKDYCNSNNIEIIGDTPIYVDYDSVDVWSYPEIFELDKNKIPLVVSGVPPDYFSANGQLWGNPVYRWRVLQRTGYRWWVQRIRQNLVLFDLIRLDHFRGFVASWQVSAQAKTARKGKWVKAPAQHFLKTLHEELVRLPIIAEDLGTITDDVRALIQRFHFPGMRVLLFAFGDDASSPYLPHNHVKNCVVYTGTHDNNTVRGWFEHEASPQQLRKVSSYTGRKLTAQNVHHEFTRLAMMSIANTSIIPMQDILGLGNEARMNRPARMKGNWQWRFLPRQLTASAVNRLADMTERYGRA
jgi:4-alpha-glucanotransferase